MLLRLFIVGVLFSFSFISLAKDYEYERGWLKCRDFKFWKEEYEYEPNDVDTLTAYGECLIAKGEDSEGLRKWDTVMKKASARERIPTIHFHAEYITTGGAFDNKVRNINGGLQAFKDLLEDIKSVNSPPYPGREMWEIEVSMQSELHAYLNIPYLELKAAGKELGLEPDRTDDAIQAANYTGEQNSGFIPPYSEVALELLKDATKTAGDCAKLDGKRHFLTDVHSQIKSECQVMQTVASQLKDLEENRLRILKQQPCREDTCLNYEETRKEQIRIYQDVFLDTLEES